VPRLCKFYPGICLTTEEKVRKNLSQGKKNLSQKKPQLVRKITVNKKKPPLYLTTHNIHNRETSMPPAGFKPAISASKWSQTYTVVHVATGIGLFGIK
jgi:hypothetical protein